MSFAKNLRKIRKDKKLTQRELAERTGFTIQVISNLERGYTRPHFDHIRIISDKLHISPHELTDGDMTQEVIPFLFKDKQAFDNLSEDKQNEIISLLIDQANFLVTRETHKK
ncbi:XRE family transcriptional regulator [Staphylococcus felis]|uniref:XRE family transcriptional regulator n=1 Tax=Staphylococcus felis TaxID=46127 RepID=A0A3E0IEU4_9STAP|nr:helix-turn-helix transcriptional regulator [Staphylococcus felis]REH81381.1 XRE family transcriptional regulator [Staphylococcus felis]REH82347.1 XRE family transcriptional regulator [Staphylococcus felis]REH90202.1 XRE family transcriptional regulator [Staphylococcus felis]REI17890.1 XRE family transcriptional regulator [Staphylococcus felis]REI18756.1 XRE family transcriptional regulator [Staphylococcus felis]